MKSQNANVHHGIKGILTISVFWRNGYFSVDLTIRMMTFILWIYIYL